MVEGPLAPLRHLGNQHAMAIEPNASSGENPVETVTSAKEPKISLVVPMIIAASFFMEGLDTSIINTSLPQMASSFGVAVPLMSAAITAYLLSLAIFIPISGWIADRFGARRVFCVAIAVFTAGSVLCGLSNSLEALVASRVVQGFGGAMMTPVGRLILTRAFPKHQLMRAMTYNMLPANLGPTVGPLIGGFITTHFSWHWNFFINVPLGAIGIVLALRYIKDVPTPQPTRFDLPGFFIIAGGLASAQLAIENLGRDTLPWRTEGLLFLAAALLLAAYGFYAARHKSPVLELRMFRIRPFSIAVLVGGALRMVTFPISFLVALLLQLGFGLDPFQAGQLTFLFTVGAMTMRANVARIVRWVGLRRLLVTCSLLSALMVAGFVFFTSDTPHILIGAYLFCFGVLRNAQHQSISALAYAEIPDEHMSKGTSISSLAQRLFQSLGVAVAATLLAQFAGNDTISAADFRPVFLILAAATALTALGFVRLKPEDGWQISGHKSR